MKNKPPNYKQDALDLMEQIHSASKSQGITQDVLAEATGMQRTNVNRMLTGKSLVRLDNFLKLLDAAGLKIKISKK